MAKAFRLSCRTRQTNDNHVNDVCEEENEVAVRSEVQDLEELLQQRFDRLISSCVLSYLFVLCDKKCRTNILPWDTWDLPNLDEFPSLVCDHKWMKCIECIIHKATKLCVVSHKNKTVTIYVRCFRLHCKNCLKFVIMSNWNPLFTHVKKDKLTIHMKDNERWTVFTGCELHDNPLMIGLLHQLLLPSDELQKHARCLDDDSDPESDFSIFYYRKQLVGMVAQSYLPY